MGDYLPSCSVGVRAKQTQFIKRMLAKQSQTNCSPHETNLTAVSDCTTRTTASSNIGFSQFLKPVIPPWSHHNDHNLQRQRNQSQLNCTMSHDDWKFVADALKESFSTELDRTVQICNPEETIHVYTQLNSFISEIKRKIMSNKTNNTCTAADLRVESRDNAQRRCEPQLPASSGCRPVVPDIQMEEFEQLNENLHSTQIGIPAESVHITQPENFKSNIHDHFVRPSSSSSYYSTNPSQQVMMREQPENKRQKRLFSQFYDDYMSLGSKSGPSSSRTAVDNESKESGGCPSENKRELFRNGIFKGNHSPDLNRSKSVLSTRNGVDGNLMRKRPQINSTRIKDILLERSRIDNSKILTGSKQIKNWTIRRKTNTSQIELFGCVVENNGSSRSTPTSVGTVIAKKSDSVIRTNRGLFHLVGQIRNNKELPPEVKRSFKNNFPHCWRKVLNESGMLG